MVYGTIWVTGCSALVEYNFTALELPLGSKVDYTKRVNNFNCERGWRNMVFDFDQDQVTRHELGPR